MLGRGSLEFVGMGVEGRLCLKVCVCCRIRFVTVLGWVGLGLGLCVGCLCDFFVCALLLVKGRVRLAVLACLPSFAWGRVFVLCLSILPRFKSGAKPLNLSS